MATKIMGTAKSTAAQMQAYIKKVNPKVESSVLDMIPFYLSEGKAEGVRGDIAFAQSCLETGNFTFAGSAVTLDQNNFAGIGVTQNGMKGNSFKTPQIGIRAQIQHLKAYACNQPLNQTRIDPRFNYVKRCTAPYVEWLGIQENPTKTGWASGKGYGGKIIKILNEILKMKEETTLNIIETNLSFGGLTKRSATRRIILHHAEATSCSAQDIHRWHKNNGWAGAGYHFLIQKNGKVYRLRPEWAVGAHAQGANSDSIGICFEGAFNVEYMGQAQINAGRELVAYLKNKYGISLVQRHKDVGATDCPGAHFPFAEIAAGTVSSKPTTSVTTEKPENNKTDGGKMYMFGVREIGNGDYGNDVLLAQEILMSRGYYKGNLDKGFGPKMEAATKKYQKDRKGACGNADGIIGNKTWQDMIAL